mgnify:CR=1 FL=1
MPSRRRAGFCVKDLPACWREASLMQVHGRLRHLDSEGGCEGLARVRLFFGEPEAETFSPTHIMRQSLPPATLRGRSP